MKFYSQHEMRTVSSFRRSLQVAIFATASAALLCNQHVFASVTAIKKKAAADHNIRFSSTRLAITLTGKVTDSKGLPLPGG
ncbi:hypothetical protein FPZ43_18510 [Mucilaginibacter pallidiroseus]|uniref:Uncharacterized protein n=1 Tax=Mucilaginibacter pallidiroseus TaxID=2599295 RepID=A0A563TYG8_9SPHI|nr:hypothetical protein [Mucilaginibacter pallidiroseus]TWR24417.1 hypothetical protein FPZ43_18510 [Mucilaginibacter pallidiroseus]